MTGNDHCEYLPRFESHLLSIIKINFSAAGFSTSDHAISINNIARHHNKTATPSTAPNAAIPDPGTTAFSPALAFPLPVTVAVALACVLVLVTVVAFDPPNKTDVIFDTTLEASVYTLTAPLVPALSIDMAALVREAMSLVSLAKAVAALVRSETREEKAPAGLMSTADTDRARGKSTARRKRIVIDFCGVGFGDFGSEMERRRRVMDLMFGSMARD